MAGSRAVTVFAIVNFILGGVWLLFVLMFLVLLVSMLGRLNGTFPSPDPVQDLLTLAYGLFGMLALYVPGLVAFTVAGIGVSTGATWGFPWPELWTIPADDCIAAAQPIWQH
jgi:hypothetical protein